MVHLINHFGCNRGWFADHETADAISVEIQVDEPFAAFFSEIFAKLLGKAALINMQKANEISQRFWLCDISKAKTQLGFVPQWNLEKGSVETVKWYREHGWL